MLVTMLVVTVVVVMALIPNLYTRWEFSCSVPSNSCTPTGCRLPGSSCPWDFPGKYTGVGCHFLFQKIFLTHGSNPVSWIVGRFFTDWATRTCSQSVSSSLDYSPPGSSPWEFLGKNTGVGCHFLFQGIFLTQGSNPCILHLPALVGGFFITNTSWDALTQTHIYIHIYMHN